jgi:hypothetical protein
MVIEVVPRSLNNETIDVLPMKHPVNSTRGATILTDNLEFESVEHLIKIRRLT